MTYDPRPIDTSGIELDAELLHLIEVLAEHNHDVWALGRIDEGWSYGPGERDAASKTNPCLVPYEQLPESEKEYDRRAVTQTLMALLARGYTIRPG